jgi:hypothetical protein
VVAAPGPLTRRALLGAGAAGAFAAAGCGERDPQPPQGGDAGVLAGLLAVERELVRAWAAVAAVRGAAGATGRAVLAHEHAHAARLEQELLAARGASAAAPAPAALRDAARTVAAAAHSGNGAGALRAALVLERHAAEAYLAALPLLRSPGRRALAMALYASEAQHGSTVLAALGRDPLPDAFAGTLPA